MSAMKTIRSPLAVRFLALFGSYGLASITTLNHVTHIFTRDNYWKYQAVFYFLVFSLSFIAFPLRRMTLRWGRTLLLGAAVAYVASLITFFFSPLFNHWNFRRVFVVWDLGLCFFLSPVLMLAWVSGLYFGFALLLVGRFVPKTHPAGIVTNTDWGFRPRLPYGPDGLGQNGEKPTDPDVVVRRYVGDQK